MTTNEPSYRTDKDIRLRHGFIVWSLYILTDFISKRTLSHILRDLPRRCPSLAHKLDKVTKKPLPEWQDQATLGPMIILTALALPLAWTSPTLIRWSGTIIALWALIDTINYHVRVLWFDDITPKIADSRRGVWSSRRILFLAVFGYLQSILLFTAIYPRVNLLAKETFNVILERSFLLATLLDTSHPFTFVDACQALTSLFFLAIVIAVMSGTGYHRSEFSRGSEQS